MMTAAESNQKVDAYLRRLNALLRGMSKEDAHEIIEELRAHITEKATVNGEVTTTAVDAALAGLGDPDELAAQYATDAVLARAEVSRSPVRILKVLFRWASLSVAGFFVLLGSLIGYSLGLAFILSALLKPFFPARTGLWYFPASGDSTISLHLGVTGSAVNGRELLGWWIVPIGLAVGSGLLMLTTQFALWCVRRYRRSRVVRVR
ncbi:MAG TPA: DUF1700 domain-containing protein [Terriglobales bacterium]|jgi:uncharacterized membrane protein|nr:DUF1700 domain-containing protein [Terriglobales bacterium]